MKVWDPPTAASSVVKRGLLQGAVFSGLSASSDGMRNCAAPASKKVFPMALSLTAQITSQPSTSYLDRTHSITLNTYTNNKWCELSLNILMLYLVLTMLEAPSVKHISLSIKIILGLGVNSILIGCMVSINSDI